MSFTGYSISVSDWTDPFVTLLVSTTMYVLCTLVFLSIHSLFRRPRDLESPEPKAIEGPEQHKPGRKKRNKHPSPGSSGALETSRVLRQHDFERCLDGPCRASKRRSFHLDNVHERRKRAQVRLKMEISTVWGWSSMLFTLLIIVQSSLFKVIVVFDWSVQENLHLIQNVVIYSLVSSHYLWVLYYWFGKTSDSSMV